MKRVLGLLMIGIFLTSSISYAWPGERREFRGHEYSHREFRGHDRYEYRNGGWWFGGALAAGLAVGAIIASLPPRHDIVYVNGVQYYYDGAYYYQTSPEGYVVVQPVQPTVVVTPPAPVVVIPANYEPVAWRGQTYYTHDGKWFVLTDKGLLEIQNPIK